MESCNIVNRYNIIQITKRKHISFDGEKTFLLQSLCLQIS